jgi:hypothetical protein
LFWSLFAELRNRYSSNPEFSYQLGLTKAERGSKSVDIFYLLFRPARNFVLVNSKC